MLYLFYLSAFVAPLILFIVEEFLVSPAVVEELYKLAALVLARRFSWLPKTAGYAQSAIFGFIFGFSESVLYLINIYKLGSLSHFWFRFPTAVLMHISTMLVLRYFQNKKLLLVGFILAVFIHWFYNGLVLDIPFTMNY